MKSSGYKNHHENERCVTCGSSQTTLRISQTIVTHFFIGGISMRALLALGLLITLCASASAATAHHTHHLVFIPSSVPNSFAAVPGGYPTIHYAPPAYDDPSKIGGPPKQTLNGH
jgi:hypothetical protein